MANKFLLPVYKKVFGQSFSYSRFDDRLQMQKMVYLLQEERVNIGHYGFDWYKHGPYSQVLLDDMYVEDGLDDKDKYIKDKLSSRYIEGMCVCNNKNDEIHLLCDDDKSLMKQLYGTYLVIFRVFEFPVTDKKYN